MKVLKVKMSGQRIKYEVMKVSFKDSDLMKAKRWKWDSKGSIYCTENRLDILRDYETFDCIEAGVAIHPIGDIYYCNSVYMFHEQQGGEPLSYEHYVEVLGNVQVKGMDSSYIYVVDAAGTMLYHPTQDKVGQPVENEVVKGLVAKLEAGEHPTPSVVKYEFKGVTKYASYSITPDNLIVVVSADESDALSGIHGVTKVAVAAAVFMVIVAAVVAAGLENEAPQAVAFGRAIHGAAIWRVHLQFEVYVLQRLVRLVKVEDGAVQRQAVFDGEGRVERLSSAHPAKVVGRPALHHKEQVEGIEAEGRIAGEVELRMVNVAFHFR